LTRKVSVQVSRTHSGCDISPSRWMAWMTLSKICDKRGTISSAAFRTIRTSGRRVTCTAPEASS